MTSKSARLSNRTHSLVDRWMIRMVGRLSQLHKMDRQADRQAKRHYLMLSFDSINKSLLP